MLALALFAFGREGGADSIADRGGPPGSLGSSIGRDNGGLSFPRQEYALPHPASPPSLGGKALGRS